MSVHSWDRYYVGMAQYVASKSKDPSTKTGAVIVDGNNRTLSVGYNGFPRGMPDHPELYADRAQKLSRIIHCEMNALIFAPSPIPFNSTLYTWPFMSCDRCVVHMLQANISRFVSPKATPAQLERWGSAFVLTRQYIAECGGELIEYEYEAP